MCMAKMDTCSESHGLVEEWIASAKAHSLVAWSCTALLLAPSAWESSAGLRLHWRCLTRWVHLSNCWEYAVELVWVKGAFPPLGSMRLHSLKGKRQKR